MSWPSFFEFDKSKVRQNLENREEEGKEEEYDKQDKYWEERNYNYEDPDGYGSGWHNPFGIRDN